MDLNEKLHNAAYNKNWNEVREILTNIRSAKEPEKLPMDHGGRNALYFAMISGEFPIAARLYELGMRLDCPLQNCSETDAENKSVSGIRILQFLSHESACGRNYFFDENQSLANCCRMGRFAQAEALLENASLEELADALAELPGSLIREKSVERFEFFLDKLLQRGSAFILKRQNPEKFHDLLESFRQIANWPSSIAVDHPERLNLIPGKILRAADNQSQSDLKSATSELSDEN